LHSRDKSCRQPAFFPKPVFNPAHGPCISLVIVPDQMQETMECKYAQLGAFGVASRAGLPPSHAHGDCNVS